MPRILMHINRMPMTRMGHREHEINHRTFLRARTSSLVPFLFKHPRPIGKRIPNGSFELRDDVFEQGPRRIGYGYDLISAERRRELEVGETVVGTSDVGCGRSGCGV